LGLGAHEDTGSRNAGWARVGKCLPVRTLPTPRVHTKPRQGVAAPHGQLVRRRAHPLPLPRVPHRVWHERRGRSGRSPSSGPFSPLRPTPRSRPPTLGTCTDPKIHSAEPATCKFTARFWPEFNLNCNWTHVHGYLIYYAWVSDIWPTREEPSAVVNAGSSACPLACSDAWPFTD
jgi:hypothetical protein